MTAMKRLWFLLTTSIDCSWCKRRVRQAWIPLPGRRLTDSIRLPRVSHTICAKCSSAILSKYD